MRHVGIGDDHAVEHIGVQAVAFEHLGAERIVREQRERDPAAQRFERGIASSNSGGSSAARNGSTSSAAMNVLGLVEHPPVVAVDDDAVAPDPGLGPHPVADLRVAHGRGRPGRCRSTSR